MKIEIPEHQLKDLSKNVISQLKGLQDVQGLEITYYLWTPDKEQTHDTSGWKLQMIIMVYLIKEYILIR